MAVKDPVLVGDIGGTNVRFALAERTDAGAIALHKSERHPVRNFPNFDAAVSAYLDSISETPTRASFAFAGPKFDDEIRMTNTEWIVSERKLRDNFGFNEAIVMNDFVALARGAMVIPDEGFQSVIPGEFDRSKNIAVLGPGTGLGLSCVLPPLPGQSLRDRQIVATEGGHIGFAPQTPIQRQVLDRLSRDIIYVSFETILSGPGFLRLYLALCDIWDESPVCQKETEIIDAGLADETGVARKCIDVFCNILGGYGGNVALGLGAAGGVCIGGGVSRHIAPFINDSDFKSHFRSRGSGSWFVQDIPVKIIMAHFTALYGAASAAI
ncbi:glucokinase [Robiginitomaculum antarcticum]|uniref:glucokinase n=1 Tax=Robiginitomaculum antarcticum TaxID=437507 RepID=UPI00037E566E|nr:glucokinase [Robiginitomaculum antarcticum]